jgi:hypothetical protein
MHDQIFDYDAERLGLIHPNEIAFLALLDSNVANPAAKRQILQLLQQHMLSSNDSFSQISPGDISLLQSYDRLSIGAHLSLTTLRDSMPLPASKKCKKVKVATGGDRARCRICRGSKELKATGGSLDTSRILRHTCESRGCVEKGS